jgi:pimeloyl-ACP methyl ester carboxylesterase
MATADAPDSVTRTVTSADGTSIQYTQVGRGPGLVIVHGAMSWGASNLDLANGLSSTFTCILYDRRGRGANATSVPEFAIQKDVEDLSAILAATNACYLYGVSSGGLVALRTTASDPTIRRLIIFEIPLFVDQPFPKAALERYKSEMAAGRIDAALTTAMLVSKMGPPIMQYFPRWLLQWLSRKGLAAERKKAGPGELTFSDLAPTLYHDFQIAEEMQNSLDCISDIKAETLLISGTSSPGYMLSAMAELDKRIPNVRHVSLKGENHMVAANRDKGGKPELIANEILKFLGAA